MKKLSSRLVAGSNPIQETIQLRPNVAANTYSTSRKRRLRSGGRTIKTGKNETTMTRPRTVTGAEGASTEPSTNGTRSPTANQCLRMRYASASSSSEGCLSRVSWCNRRKDSKDARKRTARRTNVADFSLKNSAMEIQRLFTERKTAEFSPI